jgi:TolA-binding protein
MDKYHAHILNNINKLTEKVGVLEQKVEKLQNNNIQKDYDTLQKQYTSLLLRVKKLENGTNTSTEDIQKNTVKVWKKMLKR